MQSVFEGATCRNAPDLEEAERETKMWKRGEGGGREDPWWCTESSFVLFSYI
jgi:hypothetical protein